MKKSFLIFTLGTSNRKIDEFLEILNFYQIERVIDVRRWPTSRLFPHFSKENLKKFLEKDGKEYYHLENLGGFRWGGYENYIKTKEFKKGLKNLIKIGQEKQSVIICAERFPWKCHRAFIAQELEKNGIKVFHLIEKDKIWQPKVEKKRIQPKCEKNYKKWQKN